MGDEMRNSDFENSIAPLFERGKSSSWLEAARNFAIELGRKNPYVTIDMVREECPPPDEIDPRIMGVVFTKKIWERVGYTSGSRSVSHGRPICQFRLKEI